VVRDRVSDGKQVEAREKMDITGRGDAHRRRPIVPAVELLQFGVPRQADRTECRPNRLTWKARLKGAHQHITPEPLERRLDLREALCKVAHQRITSRFRIKGITRGPTVIK
jgi:hypothetical protein